MADCQSTVNDTIDKPKIKHTTFVCGATLHDSKKTTLQEAFLRYRKARQDEIRNSKQMKERELSCRKDLSQMEALRQRFIEQVKKYMGVPYSRKYWPPDSDEYNSSLFLDCCGLVRQVLRDLADDFGFQIGSWNQAYMYDTLPITIEREEDMKPGDLVFISATYYNTKSKKQRHDMTHVEIWAGEGPKTIGARWNNGKVQIWDHYKFVARSFHSETYHFKSIDTWLVGICKSFCKEHSWRRSPYDPVKKSIFALPEDTSEDEEAGDEDNICDDNVIIQSIQCTIDEVKAEIGNFVEPSHQSNASCVGQFYEDTCKYPGAEKENKEKQKTESLPDGINNSHPGSGRGDFVTTGQLAVNNAKLVINEEQTIDDNDGANSSLNNRKTMQSETLVVITEESQIGDFVTCNKDRKENYCTQKGDSDLFGADKKSLEFRLDGTVPGTKNIYGPVIDMDVSKKSQEEVASTFPSDMCHLFYKANLSCPDHVETLAKEEEISQLQSLLNSHHYSLRHASNWDGESVSDQFDSFLCQCNFNSNSIGDSDETETKGQCCCKTCSAENNTAQSGVGQNSCDGKLHEESQNPASDVQEAELENPSNNGDDSGEDAPVKSGKKGNGKKSPGGKTAKLPSYSLPTNMIPTFYVGGGNGTALVEGPLVALGWRRTVDKFDERYRLKWVECKSKINYTTFKEGEQLVNHVPNAHLLTNKLGLLNSLQEYERVTISTKGRPPRLKMSEFVPETYKLDEKNDREAFLELYKDGEVWICKPTGMNQGKGIFLIRSRDEILKLIEERDQKKQQPQKPGKPLMTRIVQRYISNPLLLDSRKFDIRAYMLIASTVPYLILYHKGYIRLSCQKYNAHDPNLTTHLTNQYIQKKDPLYKDVKEDTAWSMDKFNEYINEHYMAEKGLEKDWAYNTLTKTMQKIMIHCFNSVKHKLQCKIGFFDLFGLDFMVDSDMKVTLIEVNVNPALHINCEALKEVIPSVVEESLYLTIECFEKSRRNQALLPLSSLKSFTVLYCGSRPNVILPRQTRSVSPVKDITAEKTKMAATGASVRRGSPTRPPHHRSLTQSTSLYTSPNAQSINKSKTETVPEAQENHPTKSSLQREPTLATHSANAFSVPTIAAAAFNQTNNSFKDTDENKNSNNADDELGITTATPLTSVTTLPRPADTGQASSMITASQRKTMDLNLVHENSPASRISLTDSLLEEVKLKMTHAHGTPSAKRDRDNLERGN